MCINTKTHQCFQKVTNRVEYPLEHTVTSFKVSFHFVSF